jgi:hypothetical protein
MTPTLLVLTGLVATRLAAGEMAEGEIALSEPQCEFFVVHTTTGYALLNEQAYLGLYEGDHVRGHLNTPGVHPIEVLGAMTIDAMVESWGIDRQQATRVFHRRCRTRPIGNHDQD